MRNRLIKPLLNFLKQGISPEKLAFTIALGIAIGIIPLPGVNTILLTIIAILLKLNIPAIQFVNYAVYGLQIVLYVPFLKLGQILFLKNDYSRIIDNLSSIYYKDFWPTFTALWNLNLCGIIAWVIISIPVGFLIYYLSLSYLKRKIVKTDADYKFS